MVQTPEPVIERSVGQRGQRGRGHGAGGCGRILRPQWQKRKWRWKVPFTRRPR